jgi:hypothetical protein
LKPTASSKKWTAHHENALLPNDRLLACVTEDIVKDTITKLSHLYSESSRSKKANNLTFLCPGAVACSPLESVSADSLMPASVTPSPAVKFKILMVLSVSSGSGSSALLTALCFRIRINVTEWAIGLGC